MQKEIRQVQANLEQTKAELQKEIYQVQLNVEQVKVELSAEINKNYVSTVKWVVGLAFAQIAILGTLIKL